MSKLGLLVSPESSQESRGTAPIPRWPSEPQGTDCTGFPGLTRGPLVFDCTNSRTYAGLSPPGSQDLSCEHLRASS